MRDAGRDGFRFESVGLVHGDLVVLDHLSVVLACEGITVIAGPSGAGKSTVLRLCNRLEVPSTGRVLLDGVDLATVDPRSLRRRVGMVFQRPTPFAGTVAENLRVADPQAEDGRLADQLGQVGLAADLLDRPAADLSGGEAQRMCVARTLLTRPEVLLMDEPTSSLDVDNRHLLEDLARSFATAGIPVVWVTHDLDQAERLADRMLLLARGRLVDDQTTRRCLAARSFELLDHLPHLPAQPSTNSTSVEPETP